MSPICEYEKQRALRMAANARAMQELGLVSAAEQMQRSCAVPAAGAPRAAAPRKRKMYEVELQVEVRRSGRIQGQQPSYDEDALFDKALGIDRLDLLRVPRRRRVGIDPEKLNQIKAQRVREVDGEGAVMRGGFDSGRGVRIQGGRVYDSRYGICCHWCRQKTLSETVTCTHPDCGGRSKLPVSFCGMCLKNRQGEDVAQAEASGCWVCPRCRDGCGEGCSNCCNCGPCRKAAGLAPTGHIIGDARRAGFENVHDYLVHQKTGESGEAIKGRKGRHAWGAWLDVPMAAAPEDGTAEEQGSAAAVEEGALELAPGTSAAAPTTTAMAQAAVALAAAASCYGALTFARAVQAQASAQKRLGRPHKAAAVAAAPAAPVAEVPRSTRRRQQVLTATFLPQDVACVPADKATGGAKLSGADQRRGRQGLRSSSRS